LPDLIVSASASANGKKTTALRAHHRPRVATLNDFRTPTREKGDPSPAATLAAVFTQLPNAGMRAALVGAGIQESRTPSMHMAEGARLGIDYSYSLLDFDLLQLPHGAIGTVVELARVHGLAGLNVTHPFKQSIIGELDELSPEAAAIGAVNTVVFQAGRAIGFNTDCWGFAESFRREMQGAKLSSVLLLGAGGAGKAVARAIVDLGAEQIEIFDLDPTKAASLAARVAATGSAHARAVHDLSAAERVDGVVNATPVGMAKYPGSPLPAHLLRRDLWVADIIYFPAETELLRSAQAAGSRTLSGEGMAIFQAVKAFELITGRPPDTAEMSRHFHQSPSGATRPD
jgi:shikimate dehydrogenase